MKNYIKVGVDVLIISNDKVLLGHKVNNYETPEKFMKETLGLVLVVNKNIMRL